MSVQLMVRRVIDSYRPEVKVFLTEHWGDSRLINSYSDHEGSQLPGFAVFNDGFIVGLVTYHIDGDSCEMVSINSTLSGRGIGSMLLRSLEDEATQEGCKRIWAITTNDNLEAMRFYQKRGYELKAIHFDSIASLRLKKPAIPLVAENGILLKSEVEVEKRLVEI